MSHPLLSVLIPTVVGREGDLEKLLSSIALKLPLPNKKVTIKHDGYDLLLIGYCHNPKDEDDHDVIILIIKDDKTMTIGEKRELLYKESWAAYSWQIDDDDDIADNSIELILEAIKKGRPDCVTFEEHIDIDGKIQRSNHSLKYEDWADNHDGFDYVRTPFFKSVIRTEIARSVPIPHIRWGEDHQWARLLKPHLKTEVHIDKQLYKYIHRSSNPTERYGLDRD